MRLLSDGAGIDRLWPQVKEAFAALRNRIGFWPKQLGAEMRIWVLVGVVAVSGLVAGCGGRMGDSGWNPLGWFGRGSTAQTLEPEGGYARATDPRPGIPAITGAAWQPLNEGRLLVATGVAPVKGWHSAALVAVNPQPRGLMRADADGTLRLRFVAVPPLPDSAVARMPANPAVDTITVGLALSHTALAGVARVEIIGAGNSVVLGR